MMQSMRITWKIPASQKANVESCLLPAIHPLECLVSLLWMMASAQVGLLRVNPIIHPMLAGCNLGLIKQEVSNLANVTQQVLDLKWMQGLQISMLIPDSTLHQ